MKTKNAACSHLILKLILSLLLLGAAFFLALFLGAEKINPAAIFGRGDKFDTLILQKLRLPRALLVLLTGVLLGGSGAVFQLFFRNPLAEPGIMGISSGATLGAVIASGIGAAVTGAAGANLAAGATVSAIANSPSGSPAAPALANLASRAASFISPINLTAFLGAMGAGLLVTFISLGRAGKGSSVMLLLCGTALGTLYSAISSVILLSYNRELHSIYTWILGSFNGRGWKELMFISLPAAASIIIMLVIRNPLDLLAGGEASATSLGLEVNKLKTLVLVSGSLAVSAAVCAGGTINFAGLIAPHIVRKITGPKGKTLVPFSMIFGGILLLVSDTIARVVIAPSELPAGVITSILGVPFFISLLIWKED